MKRYCKLITSHQPREWEVINDFFFPLPPCPLKLEFNQSDQKLGFGDYLLFDETESKCQDWNLLIRKLEKRNDRKLK